MEAQMQTQTRHTQLSSALGVVLIAAALAIGAIGGYAVRGAGAEIRGAQAAPAAGDTSSSALVPRSVREGFDVAPIQAPAPRWTHEDDATYATNTVLVPRSVREGTEITPFQAPAPRWTHEDDANSTK